MDRKYASISMDRLEKQKVVSQSISICVSAQLYQQLTGRAEREGKSVSEFGREILAQSLKATPVSQSEPEWAQEIRAKIDELHKELVPPTKGLARRETPKKLDRKRTADYRDLDIDLTLLFDDPKPEPSSISKDEKEEDDDWDAYMEHLIQNEFDTFDDFPLPSYFSDEEDESGDEERASVPDSLKAIFEEYPPESLDYPPTSGDEPDFEKEPERKEEPLLPLLLADVERMENELNILLQYFVPGKEAQPLPSPESAPLAVRQNEENKNVVRAWPFMDKLKRMFAACF